MHQWVFKIFHCIAIEWTKSSHFIEFFEKTAVWFSFNLRHRVVLVVGSSLVYRGLQAAKLAGSHLSDTTLVFSTYTYGRVQEVHVDERTGKIESLGTSTKDREERTH